ncbi:MAG: PIN domain-containing protein [Actinomycetota bacterium]
MRADHPGSQFVDSNVLIYAHDRTAGERHAKARDLVGALWRSRAGVLSVQVLQELFASINEKVGTAEARRRVADYSAWRTHAPEARDVIEAIDIHRESKISFWDAMIVRSASQLGCDVLWTEDLNSGQSYRGVRAENPFS